MKELLNIQGYSARKIAKIVNKHHSSVSKELKRSEGSNTKKKQRNIYMNVAEKAANPTENSV